MRSLPMKTTLAPLAMLMLLLAGAGCKVDDASVISQAADVHKGLQPAVMDDPQLANYLQTLGNRIITAAKQAEAKHIGPDSHFQTDQSTAWMFQNMKFHFVNSKTLNAFTTGGEHMYIYTALFEQCQTEDELTAVMSHEFAHVYCRHVQQGTQRQYAIMGAAAAAGVVGAAVAKDNRVAGATAGAGVGAAAAGFLGMGFTRQDEDEADKYGFYFFMMGGWDPNRFADFFKRMIDMGYDKTPEIASDHPSLANRVENAKRRISELPKDYTKWKKPNTATPEQFAALKQRAKDLGAKMPDDASLQKAQQLLAAFPSCVSSTDNQPEQVQARKQIQQNVDAQQKSK